MGDHEPQPLSYAARPERPSDRRFFRFLFAAGVVALLVVIIVPSFGPYNSPTCAGHLSRIGRACLTYAAWNGGRLPPNLNMLVATGSSSGLARKDLVCLKTGMPFVYIAGQTTADDPHNIVAYEPVGGHPSRSGANVLHLGGWVEWLSPSAHARQLAATQARLAGTRPAATRPVDSRPGMIERGH